MSRAARLFMFWTTVPPGVGVSMDEMMEAVGVSDPQPIRSALTSLRKGTVRDPDDPSAFLPRLPVRHNPNDHLYYDLSRVDGGAIAEMVPGNTLDSEFGYLWTRITNVSSAMGQEGFLTAAELLANPETRELVAQIPIERIYHVGDTVREIERARIMLLDMTGDP